MSNIYILDVSAAQHGRIGGKEERLMELKQGAAKRRAPRRDL